MDPAYLQQLADLISTGGLVAVSLVIFVAGYKQIWVWGWHYRQVVEDRDQYRKQLFEKITAMETLLMHETAKRKTVEP